MLCGGQSSRMGEDKSRLIFRGKTFLESIISRIGKVAGPIVIAGGNCADLENIAPGTIFVADENPGCGPLEGIRVGLKTLAAHVEFGFVTGCDAPLIEPKLIELLAQRIGDHQAIVPVDGDRVYGMTAVYRTDIADEIERLIEKRELRVKFLAEHFDTLTINLQTLAEVDPELNSLMNINRQEDFRELRQRE